MMFRIMNTMEKKNISVKLNKNHENQNPIEILMSFMKSLNDKSKPLKQDSDEDYDETFQIREEEEDKEIKDEEFTDLGMKIESIDDLIVIAQKFENEITTVAKTEKSKKKKIRGVNMDNKKEKKKEDNIKDINNETSKFHVFNGKKYNVNLDTIHKLSHPLKQLKKMIGLGNIKNQIFEMIIYYLQGFEKENKNMLHSVIEGPPGVGKTKLGKIMAQIYCAMNIIPSSNFKYVKATDMIGDHIGATRKMTQTVIDEADGGVLFIDEAYALSTSETKDPYGKECMDTLNYNLSENKKKLIVIIAG